MANLNTNKDAPYNVELSAGHRKKLLDLSRAHNRTPAAELRNLIEQAHGAMLASRLHDDDLRVDNTRLIRQIHDQ